jgi:hypothetical protein
LLTHTDSRGRTRIIRNVYEACVFQALRERLRCKEIWIVGAHEWRNPDEDLSGDFEIHRDEHNDTLHKPLDPTAFTAELRAEMRTELAALNDALPTCHPGGPPRPDAAVLGARVALRRSQAQHDPAPCPQRQPAAQPRRRGPVSPAGGRGPAKRAPLGGWCHVPYSTPSWRRWARQDDGFSVVLHTEMIAQR